MYRIISLLNVTLISAVDIVMERIFESKSKELISALELKSYSSNDGSVCSPAHWDTSGSVEESWANLSGLEIFLKPSFFHVPAYNLHNVIRLVSNFNLMETISIPVVSLCNVPAIEVVLCVVVVAKVIGWVNEGAPDHSYLIKIYLSDI